MSGGNKLAKSLCVGVTAIALAAGLSAPVAAPAEASSQDEILVIDFESETVLNADGAPVVAENQVVTPGETREVAALSDEDAVLITTQSAVRIDEASLTPVLSEADPEKLAAAQAYEGILPAEMIDEPFTDDGQDALSSGITVFEPIDDEKLEVTSIAATTSRTFSLAWESSAENHFVYRNGVEIAHTTKPSFRDQGLMPGTDYTYSIESINNDGLVSTRVIPITTLKPGEGLSKSSQVDLLTYQPYVSQSLYRTFIPESRVSLGFAETWACGQAFQFNRTFGGDNRGYVTPPANAPWDSTSSRTSIALNVNWGSPAPYDISWVKSVGTTRLYEGSILIEDRTASDSGIQVTEASSSSSYAQARVKHDVGNPFCIAGSIQYNVMFRWYRSGSFQVVGWYQPTPNHEIYGGWDRGNGMVTWRQFARYDNEGFGCSAGTCGTRTSNITKQY